MFFFVKLKNFIYLSIKICQLKIVDVFSFLLLKVKFLRKNNILKVSINFLTNIFKIHLINATKTLKETKQNYMTSISLNTSK